MTDHQRWDTVPPFQRAITPNLEKLLSNSVAFTEAYCPSPHCCPSRATFFSGLYPSEHGVWNNVDVGNTLSRGLFEDVKLWSDFLKEDGYNLYFSGKWHVSSKESPTDRGWETDTILSKPLFSKDKKVSDRPHTNEWKAYINMKKVENNNIEGQITRNGYPPYIQYFENETPFKDENVVDSAVQFIKSMKDKSPWCQFVGLEGPHDPYNVPKRFLDMYNIDDIELPESFCDDMLDKPNLYRRTKDVFSRLSELEQKECLRHYLAFCSYEDALFGRILVALEEKGELDNTVIVYLSDHGDYAGEHGLWAKGLPCFNSAYHIPCIVSWKNGIINPGRVVDEFITMADFAPTFLELAGVKTQVKFSGESIIPFLYDNAPTNWRDAVFTQSNGNELYGIQRSVMTKEWKYVYNGFDYDELYDLKNDPAQMNNLIKYEALKPVLKQLSKKIWGFAYKHNDVCINPYIMVGLAEYGPGTAFEV